MSTTQDQELFDQARALGRKLAAHERIRAFLTARDALTGDTAAQRAMADYQRHAEQLDRLAYEGKPIEVADKRKLGELERQLATNTVIQEFMRRQADQLELMHQIYAALEEPLAGPAPAGA